MTNLFLIESPMQLINAVEARYQWNAEKNILLIKVTGRERNDQQINDVLQREDWDEVIFYKKYSRFKFRNFFKYHRLGSYLRRTDSNLRLFMGDFRTCWKHELRAYLKPKQTILLDDGAATLKIYFNFLQKKRFYPCQKSWRKMFPRQFFYAPFFDRKVTNSSLELFTSFCLPPCEHITLHHNDYVHLKHSFRKKVVDKRQVFFFGSKYTENKILSDEYEKEFLAFCIKYLIDMGLKVTYVAHRDDSSAKLEFIRRNLSVEVLNLPIPAELYFVRAKSIPGVIAGAYTTVLFNARKMCTFDKVLSFKIEESAILKHKADIVRTYDELKASGITVISHR